MGYKAGQVIEYRLSLPQKPTPTLPRLDSPHSIKDPSCLYNKNHYFYYPFDFFSMSLILHWINHLLPLSSPSPQANQSRIKSCWRCSIYCGMYPRSYYKIWTFYCRVYLPQTQLLSLSGLNHNIRLSPHQSRQLSSITILHHRPPLPSLLLSPKILVVYTTALIEAERVQDSRVESYFIVSLDA